MRPDIEVEVSLEKTLQRQDKDLWLYCKYDGKLFY